MLHHLWFRVVSLAAVILAAVAAGVKAWRIHFASRANVLAALDQQEVSIERLSTRLSELERVLPPVVHATNQLWKLTYGDEIAPVILVDPSPSSTQKRLSINNLIL